jgi:hypothetical protein
MINIWSHKLYEAGGFLSRGVEYMRAGLDSVPISAQHFEAGAKSITVDRGCGLKTVCRALAMAPKRVGENDMVETIENDAEWQSVKDVQWLKGFFATLLPRVYEKDIHDLWTELETIIRGDQVEISWPLEQIVATKRRVEAYARL